MIFLQNLNFQLFWVSEFEFSAVLGCQNLNFGGCGISEFEFSAVWGSQSSWNLNFQLLVLWNLNFQRPFFSFFSDFDQSWCHKFPDTFPMPVVSPIPFQKWELLIFGDFGCLWLWLWLWVCFGFAFALLLFVLSCPGLALLGLAWPGLAGLGLLASLMWGAWPWGVDLNSRSKVGVQGLGLRFRV